MTLNNLLYEVEVPLSHPRIPYHTPMGLGVSELRFPLKQIQDPLGTQKDLIYEGE